MYRNTYVQINLGNLKHNVSKIKEAFPKYKYFFGVVKADCYGHGEVPSIKAILDGGCNYLAVATLDEALEVRSKFKNIPILCLGVIIPTKENIEIARENDITITINTIEYLQTILNFKTQKIKCHIKLNTGMNRLGISKKEELNEVVEKIKNSEMILEGIYTHIYKANDSQKTKKQFEQFEKIMQDIDKENIPIIHTSASEALVQYEGLPFVNGCRLGIIMYGFSSKKENLKLKNTFALFSQVVQINELKKGDTLGYDGNYIAKENEKIAVVAIGFADGSIRDNTGREVYINKKAYKIIGNICMDMLFVKIDDSVKLYDEVEIYKNNEHMQDVAEYLNTIPYELMCLISKRVPKKYIL